MIFGSVDWRLPLLSGHRAIQEGVEPAVSEPRLAVLSAARAPRPSPSQELFKALSAYHHLNEVNGGGLPVEVQYPKYLEYRDPKLLTQALNDISQFLEKKLDWEVRPAPPAEPMRSDFRQPIARAANARVWNHRMRYLKDSVHELSDPDLKSFVERVLRAAPQEFYSAPAGTVAGHHPADEANPGGLLLHMRRAVLVGKALCDHFQVPEETRDEILSALILHDVKKGGVPWSSGYQPTHDSLAAQWLQGFNDSLDNLEKYGKIQRVIRYVSNHLGPWHKPDPVWSLPLAQQIVSYADYLASRSDLYLQV